MARPKKAEHEKRNLRLPHIRVTADEFIQIEEQATNIGVTTSEYIRNVALTHKVPAMKNRIDNSTLVELNRIGVDIQQIADRSPSNQNSDEDDLKMVMGDLVAIMKKIDSQL